MLASESSDPEIVFLVGAMNGHLLIARRRNPNGGWLFNTTCDQSILQSMVEEVLSPEEMADITFVEHHQDLDSFDQALAKFDSRGWERLTPVRVHPDYLVQVLEEVRARAGNEGAENWRRTLRRDEA